MNWELFTAFLLITFILIVTPGPVVTLVIATGASDGIRAGLVTVAGTCVGTALAISAIACGLSWVIKNAAELFDILRWLGVAYLIWLGIQTWRNAGKATVLPPRERVYFWRGVTVAFTNPKTIAFFTAFLPQFLDPSLPPGPQLAAMCAASVLIAWICDSGWAIAAGVSRDYLLNPSRTRILGRLSGLVLIGGGIWLSFARRPG